MSLQLISFLHVYLAFKLKHFSNNLHIEQLNELKNILQM